MSYLGNTIRTFPLLVKLKRVNNKQQQFIRTKEDVFPEWCSDDLKRRMRDYALRSTIIIGEGFAILRNQAMTDEERNRYTHLGFAAPNIDDLSDQENINADQLQALVSVPNQFFTLNVVEQSCARYLNICYDGMPFPSQTKNTFNRLIEAQIKSRKQLSRHTGAEDLRDITHDKGGYSVQLFQSLLNHGQSNEEKAAAMQLGMVIQLLDDLFDIQTDCKDGIYTLANTMNLDKFSNLYSQEWNRFKSLIHLTTYPEIQKRKALNWWYIFISTAFMFIGQLKRSGFKNYRRQPEFMQNTISLNWRLPDILDGIERGLKEKFYK